MAFNTVKCTAPTGGHVITLDANDQGGFDIRANGFRGLSVSFGGGQFHFSAPGSLPRIGETDIGVPVTEDGHIVITME